MFCVQLLHPKSSDHQKVEDISFVFQTVAYVVTILHFVLVIGKSYRSS